MNTTFSSASFNLTAPSIPGSNIENIRNEDKIILKLNKPQRILISSEIYESNKIESTI